MLVVRTYFHVAYFKQYDAQIKGKVVYFVSCMEKRTEYHFHEEWLMDKNTNN